MPKYALCPLLERPRAAKMFGPLGADYARDITGYARVQHYTGNTGTTPHERKHAGGTGMSITPIPCNYPFSTPPPCLTSPLHPSSFLLQSQTLSSQNLHRMIGDSRCWKIVLRTARVRQLPITISYFVLLHLPSTRVLKSLHPMHVREPKDSPQCIPLTYSPCRAIFLSHHSIT